MTPENSQMASSALQICLILGFMVLTTSGWHCGLGRATDRASAGDIIVPDDDSSSSSDSRQAGEERDQGVGKPAKYSRTPKLQSCWSPSKPLLLQRFF